MDSLVYGNIAIAVEGQLAYVKGNETSSGDEPNGGMKSIVVRANQGFRLECPANSNNRNVYLVTPTYYIDMADL
ncbi:MAG: hypothetical protein ACI97A_003642 [Planctomycetota bacterium]|jgi:hypothetical protein